MDEPSGPATPQLPEPTTAAPLAPYSAVEWQHLAAQSVEVLELYSRTTSIVRRHLSELGELTARVQLDLQQDSERVLALRAERVQLEDEVEMLRHERDVLRVDLERIVESGLTRRHQLAQEIAQLEHRSEELMEQLHRQTADASAEVNRDTATVDAVDGVTPGPLDAVSPGAPEPELVIAPRRRPWWRFWEPLAS
jgi:hypothetical protein